MIMVGIVIQTALIATFRVALYRFATEGKVVGGFEREPLESAFGPRRGRPPPGQSLTAEQPLPFAVATSGEVLPRTGSKRPGASEY
jgi:hypothetical protein